jgi:hypothetical protein
MRRAWPWGIESDQQLAADVAESRSRCGRVAIHICMYTNHTACSLLTAVVALWILVTAGETVTTAEARLPTGEYCLALVSTAQYW